jgi:hypothetical protein
LDTLLAYDGGTVATTSKAATTKNRLGISSWRVHCFTPSLFSTQRQSRNTRCRVDNLANLMHSLAILFRQLALHS